MTHLNTPRAEDVLPVSVVVPSYRRPEALVSCLTALTEQSHPAMELIVVAREDDEPTQFVGKGFSRTKIVISTEPGQVAALNAGIRAATGSIVAITDDDAVPRKDWLAALVKRFGESPSIGAVGGRDVVHSSGVIQGGTTLVVGRVLWWGRRVGRHHFQAPLQDVHFLKGANMAIRYTAWSPFDARLRGVGAQVCNDLEATLSVHHRGWRVVYDPDVVVDHYPAERHDDDGRHTRSLQSECDEQHNETYAILCHVAPWNRPLQLGYRLVIGTRKAPGILMGLVYRTPRAKVWALTCARLSAVATFRNSRSR